MPFPVAVTPTALAAWLQTGPQHTPSSSTAAAKPAAASALLALLPHLLPCPCCCMGKHWHKLLINGPHKRCLEGALDYAWHCPCHEPPCTLTRQNLSEHLQQSGVMGALRGLAGQVASHPAGHMEHKRCLKTLNLQ